MEIRFQDRVNSPRRFFIFFLNRKKKRDYLLFFRGLYWCPAISQLSLHYFTLFHIWSEKIGQKKGISIKKEKKMWHHKRSFEIFLQKTMEYYLKNCIHLFMYWFCNYPEKIWNTINDHLKFFLKNPWNIIKKLYTFMHVLIL